MAASSRPRAGLLTIGSELTAGTRVDTNTSWLARNLAPLGIDSWYHRSCPDHLDTIARAFLQVVGEVDVVISTGGLGPTADDLTRQAVAQALGVPLEEDPASILAIQAMFKSFGREMTPSNRQQALFPRGAKILANGVGTAPAFSVRLHGKTVYCLPGVPREMRWLWEKHLALELRALGGGGRAEAILRTVGIAESALGERVAELEREPGVEIRYCVEEAAGTIELRLLVDGPVTAGAVRVADLAARAKNLIGSHHVCAEGPDSLVQATGKLLLARKLTVATAESCTGGRVAAALTSLPGISDVFREGYVTYSNEAKTRLVGVPAELIERHGAVSQEVARAMATGVLERAGSDLGVGVTGIAGPGGATATKPVGLVHFAVARRDGRVDHLERRFPGDRDLVQSRATAIAIDLLRVAAGG